jgi:biotin---protein ligase
MTLEALVYAGKGVSSLGAEALVKQLQKKFTTVKMVDSAYLTSTAWEKTTAVLAMGGGTCGAWEEALGEAGVAKIHRYVMEGGKYLGFCAGAYFASSHSSFQAREKKRLYFLFEGRAVGPLWETENHLAPESAKAVVVSWKMGEEMRVGKLYYQGGCYFDLPKDNSSVEVLGMYEEIGKPAAILCRVGKGTAILCGPHPEFVWKGLQLGSDEIWNSLVEKLEPEEEFREKVWTVLT